MLKKERNMLNLGEDFPALLITDVFSGQMTDRLIKMLIGNSIMIARVPVPLVRSQSQWFYKGIYEMKFYWMVQHFYLTTTWQKKSGWWQWRRAEVIYS